nr:MAG TPA: hypothetical protein [Caudoviricetes sp.]
MFQCHQDAVLYEYCRVRQYCELRFLFHSCSYLLSDYSGMAVPCIYRIGAHRRNCKKKRSTK